MTTRFAPDSMVKAAVGRQLSTNLAGEVVILDVEKGLYYGLDTVGADVWSMLQEPSTFSAIVDRIVARYDVDRDTAAADLATLLDDLLTLGLIENHVETGA